MPRVAGGSPEKGKKYIPVMPEMAARIRQELPPGGTYLGWMEKHLECEKHRQELERTIRLLEDIVRHRDEEIRRLSSSK